MKPAELLISHCDFISSKITLKNKTKQNMWNIALYAAQYSFSLYKHAAQSRLLCSLLHILLHHKYSYKYYLFIYLPKSDVSVPLETFAKGVATAEELSSLPIQTVTLCLFKLSPSSNFPHRHVPLYLRGVNGMTRSIPGKFSLGIMCTDTEAKKVHWLFKHTSA